MPPVGNGIELIAVTHLCPAQSPTAQENAEIRPVEVVQGQTSASQGKPKEMQFISLKQAKQLSTVIAKQENTQGFLPQWRQSFNQLVKMCEDPAAVIQTRARPGLCRFLLPGSLLASRIPSHCEALKDFLAQKSTWEYYRFYEKHLTMFWIFFDFLEEVFMNFRYIGLHVVGAAGEQMVWPGF